MPVKKAVRTYGKQNASRISTSKGWGSVTTKQAPKVFDENVENACVQQQQQQQQELSKNKSASNSKKVRVGLQERNINVSSPDDIDTMVVKKKVQKQKPIRVTGTQLKKSEQKAFELALDMIDKSVWDRSENGTDATHVIIGKNTKRTVKVLNGIMRGAWILDINWICESITKMCWISESDYEATKIFPSAKITRAWKDEGVLSEKLLKGLTVFVDPNCKPSSKAVKELVIAANGTLAKTRKEADLVVVGKQQTLEESARSTSPSMGRIVNQTRFFDYLESCCDDDFDWDTSSSKRKSPVHKFNNDDDLTVQLQQQLDKEVGQKCESNFPAKILQRILEFTETRSLYFGCFAANRSWNMVTRTVLNRRCVADVSKVCIAIEDADGEIPFEIIQGSISNAFQGMCANFSKGIFLSEGSYKSVYKVWCESMQRYEAMSVMDYSSIYQSSNLAVVAQEVNVSLMVSELVANGLCSNFVETYQVFQMREAPPKQIWGQNDDENEDDGEEDEAPSSLYQYIRMELCDLGDFEEYLKSLPNEMLDLDATLGSLFQICFSLHMGQKHLNLQHFDIKLLNFFLQSRENEEQQFLAVLEGGEEYVDQQSGFLVKLADFGTADLRGGLPDTTVTIDHFTTLENSPPEFLLVGNNAQVNGADAFAVGLCMLHLFTGGKPYEEIMEKVTCPKPLKKSLQAIWLKDKEFSVLKEVLDDDPRDVLYDTLYRFMVILGLPEDVEGNIEWGMEHLQGSKKVTKLLEKALLRKGKERAWTSVQKQYEQDRMAFALFSGTNKYFERAWDRLNEYPDTREILQGLLAISPNARWKDMSKVLNILHKLKNNT